MPDLLDLPAIAAAMAATAHQAPTEAFRAVEALAATALGPSLFTVNRVHPATVEVERVYSSDPASYPVAGRKQKRGTAWAHQVIDNSDLFVATGPAAIREHFDDHARILALGIAEIVNQPIRLSARTVAVLNLSRPSPRFHDAERPTLLILAALLLPLVLPPPAG